MNTGKRVLKTAEIQAPVLLEDPLQVRRRREAEAEDIIRMARIKADRTLAESYEAIRQERDRLRLESERVLADLEARKAEILAELEAEAEKRAVERVEQELRPRLLEQAAAFEAFVKRGEELFEEVLTENRNDLVDLAVKIAEKIVGKVSSEDRTLVERTALRVIEAARDRQEMTLRVHPDDLEALERLRIPFLERFDDLKKMDIETDRRVDRGGVWIETPTGFIDGRIRSQLEETTSMLLPDSENPQTKKKGQESSGDRETPEIPPVNDEDP